MEYHQTNFGSLSSSYWIWIASLLISVPKDYKEAVLSHFSISDLSQNTNLSTENKNSFHGSFNFLNYEMETQEASGTSPSYFQIKNCDSNSSTPPQMKYNNLIDPALLTCFVPPFLQPSQNPDPPRDDSSTSQLFTWNFFFKFQLTSLHINFNLIQIETMRSYASKQIVYTSTGLVNKEIVLLCKSTTDVLLLLIYILTIQIGTLDLCTMNVSVKRHSNVFGINFPPTSGKLSFQKESSLPIFTSILI